MQIAEIELEILTPMFCYGNTKKAEFRVTELKALMRSTFRELYYFENLNDMKEKESKLFGDIEHKSPIAFKVKAAKKVEKYEYEMLPHKPNKNEKMKREALKVGGKISLVMMCNNENLDAYINLLMKASVVGSLGMRARKGFGSFKISNIKMDIDNENKYMSILNETPINILKNFDSESKYKLRKMVNKSNDEMNYEFTERNSIEYPYIKNIKVIKLFEEHKDYLELQKKVSGLTHDRLDDKFPDETEKYRGVDKSILGNYRNGKLKINRFASPVYVSFYENNQDKYMIIKELNYNYMLKNIGKKECIEKIYIKEFDEKHVNYVNDYISKLVSIGEGDKR